MADSIPELNREIAHAFGITDLSDVAKITLTLAPNAVPTIHVERFILPKQGTKIVDRIRTVMDVPGLRAVPAGAPVVGIGDDTETLRLYRTARNKDGS